MTLQHNGGSVRAKRISYDLRDEKTRQRAVLEICAAIYTANGNAVHAARELGVSHRAFMHWVQWGPGELRAALEDARAKAEQNGEASPESG